MEKGSSKTVRASAALAGSGAFDAAPTPIALSPNTRHVTLYVTFARGSSTSAFALRVKESLDGVTWYYQTAADGGAAAASAPWLRVPFSLLEYRSAVPASGSDVTWAIPLEVTGGKYVAFEFGEYGDTANPGTLAAVAVEGAS